MTDEVGLLIQPLLVRCQKKRKPGDRQREQPLNKYLGRSKIKKTGELSIIGGRFMRPAEGKIGEKQKEYRYPSSYCET